MAADILVMQPAATRLRAEQADKLRQALLPFEDELPDAVDDLLYRVDRLAPSKNDWTFVMLSPEQNFGVVRYLNHNSKRPSQALDLWAACFLHLNQRTGEIMLSRGALAETVGITPKAVTAVMGELEKFGAISRKRQKMDGVRGRGIVRYFMNPNVATHLKGKARDRAQEAAAQLALPEPPRLRIVALTRPE